MIIFFFSLFCRFLFLSNLSRETEKNKRRFQFNLILICLIQKIELCKLVSDSSAIYNDSNDLVIPNIDSEEDFRIDVKYVW